MPEKKIRAVANIPAKMHAWLNWQSSIEGRSVSAIIAGLLREYHAECKVNDPATPDIEEADHE
jgi:hypothetical protein